MSSMAGPGILFWGFSVTFMAIDWILSLDPNWFSTIFGLLFIASQGLTAMAFLITLMVMLSNRRPMSEVLTPPPPARPGQVHAGAGHGLGVFFVLAVPDHLGRQPARRDSLVRDAPATTAGSSSACCWCSGHFALPFALLLSRDLKRNFKFLASIAVFILLHALRGSLLAGHARASARSGFGVSWMDFAVPVGLGGIWLAYFLTQLEKRPLMPLNDPHLEEALEHGRD